MRQMTTILVALMLTTPLFADGDPGFNNTWELIRPLSSEISHHRPQLTLDIRLDGDLVTIIQEWGRGRRTVIDTMQVTTDGKVSKVLIKERISPTTIYSALDARIGAYRSVTAEWLENGTVLRMKQEYDVKISQGRTRLSETHTLKLSGDKQFLTYYIDRASRKDGAEIKFVFKVAGSLEANVMFLENDWRVKDDLQRQAMLISLQGLANRSGPNLYFVYPEDYPFTYTKTFYEWLRDRRGYTFRELKTPEAAIEKFREAIKGYIVWDKDVRTSLTVAYTVAGLEDAIVVTEEQIPMVEKFGLKMVEDFRGKFVGQTDAEIYSWAIDQYWKRCSRKYIVWLGGESGPVMKPGVADWGIYNKVFFQDLSNDPKDTEEYNLAKKLLSEMDPEAIVMGWHSYAKDTEEQNVTLTSSYGLVVEGLNTLPNMSFEHHIPYSEGFQFKNNHHIQPGKEYKPEKKVYISCIQTDGIGIGAWLKPGRGEIPYAWETIMNLSWMAPGLLEFFCSTATPNDYFIGCLSGPGYMYPKAVPRDKMPGLLKRADKLIEDLDIRVFEIMDYSEGTSGWGNVDLPKDIVDQYYKYMPDAIGFINGYVAAGTFTIRDGRPFVSYDYYLSPSVPAPDAIADLKELATVNSKRPYFLLIHVRESSSVERVKSILDQLPDEFELVPLDIFLTLASKEPTFKEYYLEK